MLIFWIGEIMHIELSVPISHHGLMIVCPAVAIFLRGMLAIGTYYLNVMHAYHR